MANFWLRECRSKPAQQPSWHRRELVKRFPSRENNNLITQHPQVAARIQQMHADFVAGLPSLDSIPPYDNHWVKPPEGWGWIIGEGKK